VGNSLVNTDLVAREILKVAHERLAFIGTIDRQYDKSYFGTGAQHGASLRVEMPNEYVIREGRVMDVQDQDEATQTITAATQWGVDMRFNGAEMALCTDGPTTARFLKKYVEPAGKKLASALESHVLQGATKYVANLVGTAGVVPGASGDISMIGQARARLNQFLAPMDDRALQIDSDTMASIVNGTKSLFHDGAQVKEAFREGYFSRAGGFDWYENERTLSLANGSDISGTINDSGIATGDTSLTVASLDFNAGQVFTLGTTSDSGVYAVHPETKASYPFLRQFVASAAGTTTFTPVEKYVYPGAKQNVSALPVNGKAVTGFGTASLTYRNALAYHKDFCAFVTADLPMMADAAYCTRRNQDGLAIRVWQGSDIRNDELLMRLDVLFGYKVLRPDWACRINCT
jgi:hypothetical protein